MSGANPRKRDAIALRIVLPTRVLVDAEVTKVGVQGEDGAFTMLPRHVDVTAALAAGIVSFTLDDSEHFVAVNGGILVKQGASVTLSTTEAATGDNLDTLRDAVRTSFLQLNEKEEKARNAMDRIEADFIRRITELEHPEHA